MISGSKVLSVVDGGLTLSFDILWDCHKLILPFLCVKKPESGWNTKKCAILLKKNMLNH